MSTHNIRFCGEIRNILIFFGGNNALSAAMVFSKCDLLFGLR